MIQEKSWTDRLFKRPDPRELVRSWQQALRKEQRAIERQIMDIQREQKKAEKLIKEAAKRNDMVSAKILAKEYVQMRRTITKLAVNKASMLALSNQMTEQLAMARVAGSLQKSSEVMGLVNNLIKVPELQKVMAAMSKEMMKAGMIEEMVQDAMDSAIDSEELEEETEEQIDKILLEVAGETLGQMAAAPRRQAAQHQQQAVEQEDSELAERLAAIKAA